MNTNTNTPNAAEQANTTTPAPILPPVEKVGTMEGSTIPITDANWCDYYEEYTENPTWTVYTQHQYDPVNYSEAAINELCDRLMYHEDTDAYYHVRGLWRHGMVITQDTGTLMREEDAHQWNDGEYYEYEEEEEETECYRREYHQDTNPYFHRFITDKQPRLFIGYEIEKEDRDALECMHIDTFEQLCPKWRKESDGSLNESTGYELISPAFELNPERIREYIEERPTLVRHINAEKSERCGGHINVSEDGLSGRELFDRVKGYTPLFHALYYKRIDKNYTKAKSNEDLKHGDKYQSIRIHGNRIELRIISAVPNVNTLIWRTRLIEHMMNNQTDDPRKVFFDFCDAASPLHALIGEMYQTDERRHALRERLIEYTRTFEGIDLTQDNKPTDNQ
jgi:hypothetical protein